MSSEVVLEFRRVNVFSAIAWLLAPWLLVLFGLALGTALLVMRGVARGHGDSTLRITVIILGVMMPCGIVYAYTRSPRVRGVMLCRVISPRSMIGEIDGRTFAGITARAPLHLFDGRLFITDDGTERALAGKVDKVVIGTCGKRWCSFVEFTAGSETRRVQAAGRLPREIADVVEHAVD